jgi:hypothetical protein
VRQFEVYENPEAETKAFAPYLVILSSHLSDLRVVVFAPLFRDRSGVAGVVEVKVELGEERLFVSLLDLASVDPQRLRRRIGSLLDHEYDIRRGLDRLFNGF